MRPSFDGTVMQSDAPIASYEVMVDEETRERGDQAEVDSVRGREGHAEIAPVAE